MRSCLGLGLCAVLLGCGSSDAGSVAVDLPTHSAPSATVAPRPTPVEAGQALDGGQSVDATPLPAKPGPYPIVLVHGMGWLDGLQLGPVGLAYWPKVVPGLAASGETAVFAVTLSPFNASDVRALELEDQIREILSKTGASKVNLIAHSQGGIDARYLVSQNGRNFGKFVASVTTISTPHRGSEVADLALLAVPGGAVDSAVSALLGLLQRSVPDLHNDPKLRALLKQLSTGYMNNVFNPSYPDAPGVRYESYAGRSNLNPGLGICDGAVLPNNPLQLDEISKGAQASAIYLEVGIPLRPNDGLVRVESAKWGAFVQCVPADHTDEVGRGESKVFDHVEFVRQIVARVRTNGF
jgi:triacylglycerol lipase